MARPSINITTMISYIVTLRLILPDHIIDHTMLRIMLNYDYQSVFKVLFTLENDRIILYIHLWVGEHLASKFHRLLN